MLNRIKTNELIRKIETLREYEALQMEVAAEITAIKDSLKSEMELYGLEEMEVGQFVMRNTVVISHRLDTTALKRTIPQVYAAYTKQVTSRRFSIT